MKMKLSQLSRSFSLFLGVLSLALMKKKLQQLAEASLSFGGKHIIQAWLFKVNRLAALALSSKHSCITIVFCNKVCYILPGASREGL